MVVYSLTILLNTNHSEHTYCKDNSLYNLFGYYKNYFCIFTPKIKNKEMTEDRNKYKEIGRTVSAYFKENHITQVEVAKILGFSSKQVIANQLSGKKFGKATAKKYAAAFGFNETFLLSGQGELRGKSPINFEIITKTIETLNSIIRSQQEMINTLSSSEDSK